MLILKFPVFIVEKIENLTMSNECGIILILSIVYLFGYIKNENDKMSNLKQKIVQIYQKDGVVVREPQ